MEKKLKAKMSNFKSDLSYQEWCIKYNVSRDYIEPTRHYTQGVAFEKDIKAMGIIRTEEPTGIVNSFLSGIKELLQSIS